MTETNKQEPRIKWLCDFYEWEWIDPKDNEDAFSEKDYVTINGDIHLVKINPEHAKDYMWEAKRIDLFRGQNNDGFKLYQCDSPSEIRKFIPLRFFYSKKYGKVFELNGINHPIYDMFEFICDNPEIRKDIFGSVEAWFRDKKNIENYIRVFFDNVKGRHGRFEIIETYNGDKKGGTYSFLLDRIEKYHDRKNTKVEESQRNLNFKLHEAIFQYLDLKSQESTTIETKKKEKVSTWKKCHMVFQNVLYTADISVCFDEKKVGHIVLNNEKYARRIEGSKGLRFDSKDADPIYPLTLKEKRKFDV